MARLEPPSLTKRLLLMKPIPVQSNFCFFFFFLSPLLDHADSFQQPWRT